MAATNLCDVLDQLRAGGLIVDDLQIGRMVRCRVEGDREKRGWYMLHELRAQSGDLLIVGSFGVWHGNDNGAQKIELRKTALSTEQRDSLRRRLAEDRKRATLARKTENERAAQRASKAWSQCSPTGECDYLAVKGVQAHGLRFSPSGAAVLPLLDTAGKIHGLQVIRTSAQAKARRRPQKEFWPAGLAKKEHFHLIGIPQWIVLIAEGYATAATLHESTGYPVAVAFDAGNLAPVAAALRKRYKQAKILICADDDAFSEGNPGITAASAAALEVNGAWVAPTFLDDDGRREKFGKRGIKLTDFNDLHALEGLHVVRTQIEAKLTELGWRASAKAARSITTEGAGHDELKPIETLDELLERYALVYGQRSTVFDRQEHCLITMTDMREACITRGLHRQWAEHPDRAIVRVREVGFDPAGTDPAIRCNLWGGWPTTPSAGKCEKLLELLRYMCSADHDAHQIYAWVLNWIAYPIQRPGAKLKTTLVLHGPSGTGKNMFFEVLMQIYGHYGRVIDQTAIEDRFNDWASRKLFLIADEVVARSDLYHVKNRLKAFITGEWIRINPKNMAAYDERNHVNVVFLSNEAMPVVLEEDDRRHVVIWTPAKLEQSFYLDVMREIADGGIGALHDYLLHHDTGDFQPGTLPPRTAAKAELINLSLDSTSQFFHSLLCEDIPEVQVRPALSQDVYELYKSWCARNGDRRVAPMPRLLNALARRHNVIIARKRYMGATGVKGPHGIVMFGAHDLPPGQSETNWLGDHVDAFRESVKAYKGTTYA